MFGCSRRKLAGVLISSAVAILLACPVVSAAPSAVGAARQSTLKGGDAMYTVSPGPGREPYYCSAGFAILVKDVRYILTAGHCTEHGLDWEGIGPNVDTHFPVTDYGRIRDLSGSGPSQVDLYDGRTQRILRAGIPQVGQTVCKSGMTTKKTCGKVLGLNQTVNYGKDKQVIGTIATDIPIGSGDSGGPLFYGGVGYGVLSGGNSQVSFYQPLRTVLTAYGATLA
ncbi:secreted serine protease [Amycolatopsis azurea DSM 43854]|uniref:Secreted serine protease n=2 Tax=Amycolatopsis azurea TaxID=36819 RepID=M2QNM2_9PSEU|nr:secreted serine protease [Amycolatopsis azurea DSM 43854]OOC00815.1 secreted serine protease [Amycolatopsis azurea DSM 43854]